VNPPAVVLLSGGLDSCVTAAIAADAQDLALLHVDYGQRTRTRERRAFAEIADFYDVPESRRLLAETDVLSRIGGSALTDPAIPVPQGEGEQDDVPVTYVPFRNAHLLSLGVSWAEVLGAGAVYIGAVEEDSSGYPDCTEAFCVAFARAVEVGTSPRADIQIVTPVIHHDKAEIVRIGSRLGAPLHLTWSCYTREDVGCGCCESCTLRQRAFRKAGVPDPLPYAQDAP
jgi:7-cyano-7-deazaguanine synthase